MSPRGPDGLYHVLYDLLCAYGHRPGLHIVPGDHGQGRAWLSAAGFGALGQTVSQAARLYVQAGASLAADPLLRAELERLDRSIAA